LVAVDVRLSKLSLLSHEGGSVGAGRRHFI